MPPNVRLYYIPTSQTYSSAHPGPTLLITTRIVPAGGRVLSSCSSTTRKLAYGRPLEKERSPRGASHVFQICRPLLTTTPPTFSDTTTAGDTAKAASEMTACVSVNDMAVNGQRGV
jgi:hypothetical protein